MRKYLIGVIALVLFIVLTAETCYDGSAAEKATDASAKVAQTAYTTIPVPSLSYFQERRTVNKWANYWDKPNLPTYVYLFVFDKCIGYYVADGKPAATTSYMTPERALVYVHSNYMEQDVPDIDGTYGTNNPGIRFFTAGGIPVEFGGSGCSYLYSAAPIPLDVPKLDLKRQ